MSQAVRWTDLTPSVLIGRDLVEIDSQEKPRWRGPIAAVTNIKDSIEFERSWTAVSEDDGKSWQACDPVPAGISKLDASLSGSLDDTVELYSSLAGGGFLILKVGDNLPKPAPQPEDRQVLEKFTQRARKVFQLTEAEAIRANHEYLDTGHLLMALMKEGSGVAANVLRNLGLELAQARQLFAQIITPGPENNEKLKGLPQSPRLKNAIAHALEVAKSLDHKVGTEHLLLGLVHDPESVACQLLLTAGISPEDVAEETLKIIGHPAGSTIRFSIRLTDEEIAALEKIRVQSGKATAAETLEALLRYRLAHPEENKPS